MPTPKPRRVGARSSSKPVVVRRIVPDLRSADPTKAVAFYRAVLGLDLVMDLGWIATVAAPGPRPVQLSLMRADATARVFPQVSIEVDDVDAAHRAAVAAGAEIVHPLTDEPWGVRRFFMRDPDGNVINVLGHAASR